METPRERRGETDRAPRHFWGKRANRALVQFGILILLAFALLHVLGTLPNTGHNISRIVWVLVGFYSLVRLSEYLFRAVKLAFFVP